MLIVSILIDLLNIILILQPSMPPKLLNKTFNQIDLLNDFNSIKI